MGVNFQAPKRFLRTWQHDTERDEATTRAIVAMTARTRSVSVSGVTANGRCQALRYTIMTRWRIFPSGPVPSRSAFKPRSARPPGPGLTQMARALARVLDNPKATSSQPAAAKVPASLRGPVAPLRGVESPRPIRRSSSSASATSNDGSGPPRLPSRKGRAATDTSSESMVSMSCVVRQPEIGSTRPPANGPRSQDGAQSRRDARLLAIHQDAANSA